MPEKNGGISCSSTGGGLFRRAQSLRFPRPSGKSTPSPMFLFSRRTPLSFSPIFTIPIPSSAEPVPIFPRPANAQCPSPSSSAANLARSGSRAHRSKSSRHRFGSIEAQSLLGRMSSGQRMALVASWRQVGKPAQLGALVRKILVELEQTEPLVREIFFKAGCVDCWEKAASAGAASQGTLDEHVRLIAKLFDDLVSFVESAGPTGNEGGEEITGAIKKLGQQHAILAHSSGLHADVWEKLGEIAMEKICATEAVQRMREAGRAWRTLIAFLTDKIRCGFEGEAKAFSRRPSTDLSVGNNGGGNDGHGQQCEELERKLQELMRSAECEGK